jgi:Tol biopolymer transport system component/predicted Ser/Thr protein kinase
MSLGIGTKLGPYEILAPIGAGGMGTVYKARDPQLDRIVAIKVAKYQFNERFELEARAIAALNHPHICQVYDVGPNYLVMELIEGTPLKGPLPLDKAIEYAGQILDALDAAHKKCITHRDLKPANILVTKQGIKLLDFGLAKETTPLKETDGTRALTGQGQILGTLQYMSPEQLQGKDVDARSDLFSFGCVMYEMLTGKRAFEGQSPASVIAAILEREPAPLEVARPVDRVIKRSLAKDPDQRFQTARDLKAALAWATEQPLVIASTPSRRWHWIAAASLALAVFAGGGWALVHFRKPSTDERVLRLQIDPPEGGRFVFGNNAGGIALSPDGGTAVYVASVKGKAPLWARPIDGIVARPLAGTEGASYPFWSPDSKSIGFFAAGKLQRIDVAGGAPLTICDVGVPRGGTWMSNGLILFGSLAAGLFQVPATGGTPSPLTTLDIQSGEGMHRWPQALPGGRFLYWVRSDKTENTGIYAGSLVKAGERVKLLTTDTNAVYAPGGGGAGYLLWLRGGTLMAQELNPDTLRFTGEPLPVADPVARIASLGLMNAAVSASGLLLYSSSNNVSQLISLDRTGNPFGEVGDAGEYSVFRLSPDGGRVAATRDRPGGIDVWLLGVGRRVSNRFTSATAFNQYPIWSPDGRTILFSSSVAVNLYRKDSGGAGSEERITQSPTQQYATDWSRDGRLVLGFGVAPGTQRDIWVLPVTPEGRPTGTVQPYVRTSFNESWARFSPDTRWVAYQSDESGRYEVYIQSFPEKRGAVQVSESGGQYPQWGPGGHELFYVSPNGKLLSVNLTPGSNSVKPSAPRELFVLPTVDIGWSPYDVTADGQRFLVRATPEKGAALPLTVIVNWPALLKKGAESQ